MQHSQSTCSKADAVHVEQHSEYKDLINNAHEKNISKLTMLVHINTIKEASKKVCGLQYHYILV